MDFPEIRIIMIYVVTFHGTDAYYTLLKVAWSLNFLWCFIVIKTFISHQRSCRTSGPVSTGMGDRLWRAYHPGIFTKLPRPTQPPTLSGTGNEYRPKGGDALSLGNKAGWFIPHVDKCVGGMVKLCDPVKHLPP